MTVADVSQIYALPQSYFLECEIQNWNERDTNSLES